MIPHLLYVLFHCESKNNTAMVRKLMKFLVKSQENRIQEAFSQITLDWFFVYWIIFPVLLRFHEKFGQSTHKWTDQRWVPCILYFIVNKKLLLKNQPNDALTWWLFFLISLHYIQLCADSTTMTQFPLLFSSNLHLIFRLRAYSSSLISLYFSCLQFIPFQLLPST